MKKLLTFLLIATTIFCTTVTAKVGDVIGSALHTDIYVYINGYAIPSYAVNGQSAVVAEDLRNYGFNVIWNQWSRSLEISPNANADVNAFAVYKNHKTGDFFSYILETDIKVYADGYRLTSYALNGYTMIPVEELRMYGNVIWNPTARTLSADFSWFPHKLDFANFKGEWDTRSWHLASSVDARIKIIGTDRVNQTVDIAYKVDEDSTSIWTFNNKLTIDDYPYKNIRLRYAQKTLSKGKMAIVTDVFELLDGDKVTMILDEDGNLGLGNTTGMVINRTFKRH